MLPLQFDTAKLADFRAPTTRILFGQRLKEVQQIEASIARHGLLNPLIVMQRGKRLIVVDGKKRLAALRRMKFNGTLPRSLVNVPYVLIGKEHKLDNSGLSLLSNEERFEEVRRLRSQGRSFTEIASMLYISNRCVKDLTAVSLLSPRLRQAYFGGTISSAQARAFASIPNMDAQDNLLIALGPFADAPEILSAIENGKTVIDMGDDNVVILPSRRPLNTMLSGPNRLAA
jgi:ParB-like chromosome segregation protein Spo0J